jgi:hypothetical protein
MPNTHSLFFYPDLMMVTAQAQKLKGPLMLTDHMRGMEHRGIFKQAAEVNSGWKIQIILVLPGEGHLIIIIMACLVQEMLQKLRLQRWRAMALLLHLMALW